MHVAKEDPLRCKFFEWEDLQKQASPPLFAGCSAAVVAAAANVDLVVVAVAWPCVGAHVRGACLCRQPSGLIQLPARTRNQIALAPRAWTAFDVPLCVLAALFANFQAAADKKRSNNYARTVARTYTRPYFAKRGKWGRRW